MSDEKITQVLVDPKWGWGTMQIGDAPAIPFITLHHPVYGAITSIVPASVVQEIIAGLTPLVMTKQ